MFILYKLLQEVKIRLLENAQLTLGPLPSSCSEPPSSPVHSGALILTFRYPELSFTKFSPGSRITHPPLY